MLDKVKFIIDPMGSTGFHVGDQARNDVNESATLLSVSNQFWLTIPNYVFHLRAVAAVQGPGTGCSKGVQLG